MKSRDRWLIFILIGLSLTSCGQPNPSEIAETVKKSIVLISYQNEGGHGTGFIVEGKTGVCTVLTARHVVEGHSLNLQTNDQKIWKTDSIQASPNLDLAVVTFPSADKNCPYPSLTFGDSDSVKQSDQIYISGFPDRVGSSKLVQQFVRGSVNQRITKADYTKLEQLLAAGQWKEADLETGAKMLEVAGRQKEGWLDTESIEKFSCPDLRAMDRLWVKYSNGRFGFSVQKRIYQSLGGTKDYNEKVWAAFSETIGWKRKGKGSEGWLYYGDLTFNTNAPSAHLPAFGWNYARGGWCWGCTAGGGVVGGGYSSLMQRLVKCNL